MSEILVLEDDEKLGTYLLNYLKTNGYETTLTTNFDEFENSLDSKVKLMILDRLIGKTDIKEKISLIKKLASQCPIIIVSAINTPHEKAELLNLGVDDYLGKPFSIQELMARVKALLRRTNQAHSYFIKMGNTLIDTNKRSISVEENTEIVPAKEFLLLSTLAQNPGRVWNKNDLLDIVWGASFAVDTNVVESTIANLRKRLVSLKSNLEIRNMRNAGYWLEE